jgi:hypothetical protein
VGARSGRFDAAIRWLIGRRPVPAVAAVDWATIEYGSRG